MAAHSHDFLLKKICIDNTLLECTKSRIKVKSTDIHQQMTEIIIEKDEEIVWNGIMQISRNYGE